MTVALRIDENGPLHVEQHLDGLARAFDVMGLQLGQDFRAGQGERAVETGAGRLDQVDGDSVGHEVVAGTSAVAAAGDVFRTHAENHLASGSGFQRGGALSGQGKRRAVSAAHGQTGSLPVQPARG